MFVKGQTWTHPQKKKQFRVVQVRGAGDRRVVTVEGISGARRSVPLVGLRDHVADSPNHLQDENGYRIRMDGWELKGSGLTYEDLDVLLLRLLPRDARGRIAEEAWRLNLITDGELARLLAGPVDPQDAIDTYERLGKAPMAYPKWGLQEVEDAT